MKLGRYASRLSCFPWFRLTALLGLTALILLSLTPAEHAPPRTRLPGQVEHFLAYACVSALTAFAFRRAVSTWQLAGAFIGYAAVLEYAQRWSVGRSASVLDFLGSSAGALAGICAATFILYGLATLDQTRLQAGRASGDRPGARWHWKPAPCRKRN